mgnify:FL=1
MDHGDWLGIAGATTVVATGLVWFRLIDRVAIPRLRAPFFVSMAAGALLGALALIEGTGLAGGLAAVFAIAAGLGFDALRLQSAQARCEPSVVVGGPILDFTAPDENGQPFDLASLRGRPFLLKFFRGHW